MNKILKFSVAALAVLIASAQFITSCTKEADKIGLNIQPPGDKLNVFVSDTFSVIAYSLPEDSVRTDETNTSMLGSVFDPVFGKTTASIFTELRLTSTQLDFGAGASIDSIVLTLSYRGIWGDSATVQTFRVFELNESIHVDSAYFSNSFTALGPQIGFEQTIPYIDSIPVDTIKVAPYLRIPLNENNTLATKLLSGTSDDFSTNDKFRAFFKGICITSDPADMPGKGALLTYNLLDERSNLTVYYKNTEKDSLKYSFFITNAGARYNQYNHFGYEDAAPDFKQQVLNGDTTLGAHKIYLQPMSGVKTHLRFPTLTALGSKISINEARLVFTNIDSDSPFANPLRLVVGKITDEKGTTTLTDDQLEGDNYYGGYYNSESKNYQFRISLYAQDRILNPTADDFGLALLIPGAASVSQRVILNGSAAASNPLKLIVTYTRLD